jgi:hypothetical protein
LDSNQSDHIVIIPYNDTTNNFTSTTTCDSTTKPKHRIRNDNTYDNQLYERTVVVFNNTNLEHQSDFGRVAREFECMADEYIKQAVYNVQATITPTPTKTVTDARTTTTTEANATNHSNTTTATSTTTATNPPALSSSDNNNKSNDIVSGNDNNINNNNNSTTATNTSTTKPSTILAPTAATLIDSTNAPLSSSIAPT